MTIKKRIMHLYLRKGFKWISIHLRSHHAFSKRREKRRWKYRQMAKKSCLYIFYITLLLLKPLKSHTVAVVRAESEGDKVFLFYDVIFFGGLLRFAFNFCPSFRYYFRCVLNLHASHDLIREIWFYSVFKRWHLSHHNVTSFTAYFV